MRLDTPEGRRSRHRRGDSPVLLRQDLPLQDSPAHPLCGLVSHHGDRQGAEIQDARVRDSRTRPRTRCWNRDRVACRWRHDGRRESSYERLTPGCKGLRYKGRMAASAHLTPEPERLYRIGDVSRITDTKPFVLRFWETEFPMLQPVKAPKGHRLYREEDIELIRAIKRLLYEEGFTIPGARRHLSELIANDEGLASLLEPGAESERPSALGLERHPLLLSGAESEAASGIAGIAPMETPAARPRS